ncbi:MAG: hypothetical protein U5J62_10685 [Desulfurivibrio sp.]|nr:hypothetical protein [Desulfurivibrio sp.]
MATHHPHPSRPVPWSARIGWLLVWLAIIVVVLMIAHNCVNAFQHGRDTSPAQVEQAYQQGLAAGRAGADEAYGSKTENNPVLYKAFIKGYRRGADQSQRQR